jgi:hypothetical protein
MLLRNSTDYPIGGCNAIVVVRYNYSIWVKRRLRQWHAEDPKGS